MMKKTLALIGPPNTGKTSLFNLLCGAHAKTGNWPGTTVESREGEYRWEEKTYRVVDFPGLYSLNAFSADEAVTRDYLLKERPERVLLVVSATDLERGLALALQVFALGHDMILCVNMADPASKLGIRVDTAGLGRVLKVPCLLTDAHSGKNVPELKALIRNTQPAGRGEKSSALPAYPEITDIIDRLARKLETQETDSGLVREKAAYLIETGCEGGCTLLKAAESREINELREAVQEKTKTPPEDYFRRARRDAVNRLLGRYVHVPDPRRTVSDAIDRRLSHPAVGLPVFVLALAALFHLVFRLGDPLVGLIGAGLESLQGLAEKILDAGHSPAWLKSFVGDGLIGGVGSVVVFVPYIGLLFLGISALESSGYLARAAFVMDLALHRLGLNGKAFIPLLLGFGCNVPAIMAVRTLDSMSDRILTVLVLPLISCSARLPVYTLFAAAFFPGNEQWVVMSLYLLGVVLALGTAKLLKKTLLKAAAPPFVLEFPPYRMPRLKHVCMDAWLQSAMFIRKAGTVILPSALVIWGLASLPAGVDYGSAESLLGRLGELVCPVFAPAGYGFWEAAVALISGVFAKETIVSTLGTLYGKDALPLVAALQAHFTPASAYAFLTMTLIYFPCIPAFAAIKNECGWKWAFFAGGYTLALAWGVSVVVFQTGSRLF